MIYVGIVLAAIVLAFGLVLQVAAWCATYDDERMM